MSWLLFSVFLAFALLIFYTGQATFTAALVFSAALIGLFSPTKLIAAFLFLDSLFHRDFTYMSVDFGGVPIFIGEWVMLILILAGLKGVGNFIRERRKLLLPYGVFFGFSLALYLASLGNWQFTHATRDFALIYYSMFALVTVRHVKTQADIKMILAGVVLGTIPNLVSDLLNFLYGTFPTTPEQMNYSMRSSFFYMISFAFLLPYLGNPGNHRKKLYLYFGLTVFLVFFYVYTKTAMLSVIFISAGYLFFYPTKTGWRILAFIVAVLLFSIISGSEKKYFSSTKIFHLNTFLGDERVLLDIGALRDFTDNPYGIGFGSNIFGDHSRELLGEVEEYHSLHNSYLTILRRTGIVGAGLFLWLVFSVSRDFLRSPPLRQKETEAGLISVGLFLAWAGAAAVYPLAHTALEGPFMGIPFWILFGLMPALAGIRGSSGSEVPLSEPH